MSAALLMLNAEKQLIDVSHYDGIKKKETKMAKIVISPYSKPTRQGKVSPKNMPDGRWGEVVRGLKAGGHTVIQIGVSGEKQVEGVDEFLANRPLKELSKLLSECDTFASVDNFCHHLAYVIGKPGVVIFCQSDPIIFGHSLHTNLLKDRKYLRPNQFIFWDHANYNDEAFVEPSDIIAAILGRDKA